MDWLTYLSSVPLIKEIVKWFSRPKIEANFEYKLDPINENDYCHLRMDKKTGNLCWFFRLGIENKGNTMVKNCNIRVERIDKLVRNRYKKMTNFSPIMLHWANANSNESRDLHKDTPEFIDIVHTMDGEVIFFIFAKPKHIGMGSNITWPAGDYRIYLSILGDNIKPYKRNVNIDFNGRWDQLKMKLLPR